MLHYRIFRSKLKPTQSTIILLHGLLGNLNNFVSFAKTTKCGINRDIYSLDLLNHGQSPRSEQFDLNILSESVIKFLDELRIEKCSILGHSLGGRVAMVTALNHPERVKSLVVEDIAPIDYSSEILGDFMQNIKGMMAIDLGVLKSRIQAEKVLSEYVKSPAIVSFLLTNLKQNSSDFGTTWTWACNLPVLLGHYNKILDFSAALKNIKAFEGPTLFIKGTESNYITSKGKREIRKYFKNAFIEAIEGAGHWVHFDRLSEFTKCFDRFYESHVDDVDGEMEID